MRQQKLTKMDRISCEIIRNAATAALAPLGESLGIAVAMRGGSFDPGVGTFTIKIEFTLKEIGGKDQARVAFERYAPLFNLLPEEYEKRRLSACRTEARQSEILRRA